MKITEILKPDLVFLDVDVASKKETLEKIPEISWPVIGCDSRNVFDPLVEH